MLRESKKFTNYMYRSYALTRIKDGFRENKNVGDQKLINELISDAKKNLEIIKRQVIISSLYKSEKFVIEE